MISAFLSVPVVVSRKRERIHNFHHDGINLGNRHARVCVCDDGKGEKLSVINKQLSSLCLSVTTHTYTHIL
jgi:hypothetical protein